ncbi:tetratricopeptide (TPR) repeat protein [Pontibacter aydingkolensis]|uniref:Tetratricopeptide repeat protein n=1 Tax=Pontibacter aydingkolensis TaxID=1911536 RepID=A0ABS7CWH9_9BACT|nr:tetratricopeptide repeat protein [Pontibacter aydingkolensis]MBW7468135.1 tetratricopeptide repeat protein [Pontibacter aydingkolensis]
MKRGNIYAISFVLLLVIAAGVFVYSRNHEEPIPPLRERQGPISTTSEWLNTKAAIEGLQYKIRKNSNDTQSKLLLAMAYMQEARVTGEHPYYFPAALKLVEDVLDRNNIDPAIRFEATVAKAMIQLSLHHFDKALETGKLAHKLNPNRASVYGVLCDAYVELGDYEKAIEMADQMVAIRPDLMSYARISYLREIHGDMAGAIRAMEMAANAGYPGLEQTAWAKYNLANLYERIGDLQMAEIYYKQSLVERPSYAFSTAGLGRIKAKTGNDKEAIELLQQAAGTIPEFSFQEELAHLYKKTGQKQKAAEIMEQLLEGFDEDEEAGHNMNMEIANVYLELDNNPDKALEYALKEYKSRPNNIDVCKMMASIYYEKKDYATANKYLLKAIRTQKQDASLLTLNGLVNYKLGKKTDGEELIRKAFSIDPFQSSSVSTEGKALLSRSLSSL